MMKLLFTLLALSRAEIEVVEGTDDSIGLHPNEAYHPIYNEFAKNPYPLREIVDFEALINRQMKFQGPPQWLQSEVDEFEAQRLQKLAQDCQADNNTDCEDRKPIIGIMTQPTSQSKREKFDYQEYILEINDNFIRQGGVRTVAIPYNISEEELSSLLRQINGVLFTGGGLKLISDDGVPHPYFTTAKRIIQYSKYMLDIKNETWPILGIC